MSKSVLTVSGLLLTMIVSYPFLQMPRCSVRSRNQIQYPVRFGSAQIPIRGLSSFLPYRQPHFHRRAPIIIRRSRREFSRTRVNHLKDRHNIICFSHRLDVIRRFSRQFRKYYMIRKFQPLCLCQQVRRKACASSVPSPSQPGWKAYR